MAIPRISFVDLFGISQETIAGRDAHDAHDAISPKGNGAPLCQQVNEVCESLTPKRYDAIRSALDSGGPGILLISGIPIEIVEARARLLRTIRDVACLPSADARATVLSQGRLGSDVPAKSRNAASNKSDAHVSSLPPPFTATFTMSTRESVQGGVGLSTMGEGTARVKDAASQGATLAADMSILSTFLTRVCLRVAQACDGEGDTSTADCLLAGTAKARAIHYYASPESTTGPVPAVESPTVNIGTGTSSSAHCWQPWHFDYGLLTGLLGASVTNGEGKGDGSDAQHGCGLHILLPNGEMRAIHIPPDCVGVQSGESACILSGGRFAPTAHCVLRPTHPLPVHLSRQQFVVFCQPAWQHVMGDGAMAGSVLGACASSCLRLEGVLPPLTQRWTPGQSFSSFAQETTRAYFGAGAVQANSK